MLCSAKELKNFHVIARDGDVGKVHEVYFDDHLWVIRHLVVDTGGWLSGRRVLVSPHAVERIDREGGRVEVALARKQIEEAPGIDTDRPVSRQQEVAQYDYYGYPYYWAGAGLWGAAGFPVPFAAADRAGGVMGAAAPADQQPANSEANPNLRSSAEVTGYHIQATDGSIGHVEDFLFDPQSWQIAHMLVETRNWLPGQHVLVQPRAVQDVDWGTREVRVSLTREEVKRSPAADTVT